jgi:hypothetical protein
MVRWIAYIKLFNPVFKHIKGKANVVSDGLSRKKDVGDAEDSEDLLDELGLSFSLQKDEYEGEWLDLAKYLLTLSKPRPEMTDAEYCKLRKWSYGFLVQGGILFRKGRNGSLPRRVIVRDEDKKQILESLHDEFGHRGVVGTYSTVRERYYWTGIYNYVREYCSSCHECQLRDRKKVDEPLRPWTPSTMDSLWFVDVVTMQEESNGYRYVILAREGLSGWVEGARLRQKRARDWITFIDREITTRYGCTTVVSDHGELDSEEMKIYCEKRGIKFLPVAEYNPRSNVVERGHKPFVDGLSKASWKTKIGWSNAFQFNSALWADRVTVKRTTGFSPYYLRYGQDCVLPIESIIGTWPIIKVDNASSMMETSELLALRTAQLTKHRLALELGYQRMLEIKMKNAEYFNAIMKKRKEPLVIGDLVLLENTRVRFGIGRKLDPFWFGPYRIVTIVGNGLYRISELDGTLLKEEITGNRLKHYKLRSGVDAGELDNYKDYAVADEDTTSEGVEHSDAGSDYDISVEEESVTDEVDGNDVDGTTEAFKNTEKGLDGSYWKIKSRRF